MRLVAVFKNLFLVVSLCFAVFTVGRILLTFQLFDFNYYYLASRDILAGRELYQNPQIDNNYPPSAFLFIWPVGLVSQEVAEKVWTLLSVGLLVASIGLLLKAIEKYSLANVLMVFSVAMWCFPVKFTLGLGQINFLILFLLALSFFLSVRRQEGWAGVCLGLAAAIKLTPLLLILFFWRKQQWRAVLGAVGIFLLLQLVALLAFGPASTSYFFTHVVSHIPTVGNASYYNQALTGFLARAGVNNQLARWLNYSFFGILLLGHIKLVKPLSGSLPTQLMEFGGFVLVSLVGAGLAWQHHFVWVLVPALGLWFGAKGRWTRWLVMMALLLIGSNLKQPELFPSWAVLGLSHVGIGASLLLGLIFHELVKQKKLSSV